MVCSVGRLAVKPLCASGLLPMPPSLVAYTRSGVTLVTDTLLPGLCERVSASGLRVCTLCQSANTRATAGAVCCRRRPWSAWSSESVSFASPPRTCSLLLPEACLGFYSICPFGAPSLPLRPQTLGAGDLSVRVLDLVTYTYFLLSARVLDSTVACVAYALARLFLYVCASVLVEHHLRRRFEARAACQGADGEDGVAGGRECSHSGAKGAFCDVAGARRVARGLWLG